MRVLKRKVICTSTGCLGYAPKRYKKYDIDIVSLTLTFEGKEYIEGVNLNPDEFYKRLETIKDPKNNLPKTSMVTIEAITSAFDKLVKDGYSEVIVITLSSYLSGSYNLIKNIAKDYESKLKVNVVDSKTCSFSEGLLAVTASKMIEDDIPTEIILKELDWIIKRQQFIAVDGKLDYLIYNGRLKGGKALIGKMLNICPIVGFDRDGVLGSISSVRTQKKALHKQCEMLKELIGDRDGKDYVLWHVYTGKGLINELIEIEKEHGIVCNHEDVIMAPVCGCHNGPWLAGYGYFPLRRNDEPLE